MSSPSSKQPLFAPLACADSTATSCVSLLVSPPARSRDRGSPRRGRPMRLVPNLIQSRHAVFALSSSGFSRDKDDDLVGSQHFASVSGRC